MDRNITSAAVSAQKLRFGPGIHILFGKDAEAVVLALAGIFGGTIPISISAEVRWCEGVTFGVYCQEGACFVDRPKTAQGDPAQLVKAFHKQRFLHFGKRRHIWDGAELPMGFAGAGDLLLEKLRTALAKPDTRPLFVINFLERLDEAVEIGEILGALATTGRQIFIAVPHYYEIKTLEEMPYDTLVCSL